MAKLRAVLDSLDGLTAEQAELYVEGKGEYEGRYVLDVEGVDGLELTNAQKAVSAKNREKQAAKRLGGEAEKLRRELEEANARIAELEESGGSNPDAAALKERTEKQAARKLEQLQADWDAKLKAATEKAERYQKSYRETAEQAALADALGHEEIRAVSQRAAKAILRDYMRWEETEDGGEQLVWSDLDGETALMVHHGGQSRAGTGRDLLVKLANDKDTAGLFQTQAPSGGGAAQSRAASNGVTRSGPRVVRLTADQMRDHAQYAPLRKQEMAGEIQIQVVD